MTVWRKVIAKFRAEERASLPSSFALSRRAARWLVKLGMRRDHPRFRDYLEAASGFLADEQRHYLRMCEIADRIRDGADWHRGLEYTEAIYAARSLDSYAHHFDASNRYLNGLAALVKSEPLIEKGRAYSASQSEKGRAGAAARWQGYESVGDVVRSLSKQRDELGEDADPIELWPEFYSALDALHLNPQEHENPRRYVYDGDKTIKYDAFRARIQRERRRSRE